MSPRSAIPTHPVLRQRKLVLTLAVLLAGLGLVSWLTMVRQEDPRLPEFFGMVTVTFPGADAETMERLVLDPIEEELGRVEEVEEILGTANAEIAFLDMDLRDDVADTDAAWDRVRQALDVAARDLPVGASRPLLDDRQQDAESIVYAVTGHPDPLVLGEAAEALEELLLAVPGVTDVTVVSDPGEQITVELGAAEARRLGVTPAGLAAQLAARNRILPGGSVEVDGRSVRLRPQSEFTSLEEIRATPVILPGDDGMSALNGISTVPLAAVARVRRGPEEPAKSRMRSDGRPAVGVGVVPKTGINLVAWGEEVRQRMDGVEDELARLTGHRVEVEELIYQPARVEARLSNLNRSLLTGALVVALVLILTMGLRLGLVVAAVVPLVSLSAMAVYALGGGVLHQMSIAAVVIALGMLVDNAIVMAEAIQWRIDHGEPPPQATAAAVRELAVPLAGATATTLAAFVPMLLAGGVTAIFTRAIPVVIMITLAVSYLFAVYVTPALAAMTLKPRAARAGRGRLGRRLGALAVDRPGAVLAGGLVVVLISFSLFPLVRQEFFPESDRNQLVVDLKLPEGSHLDATDRVARHLERELLPRPDVTGVISFIGRSAPHFYYNLSQIPWSPHFAQVVLETAGLEDLDAVMARVRQVAAQDLPQAEVVVRKLEQGPPVSAPVEVRLYGRDLQALHAGAERVMAELRSVPGTADVRHDLSPGSPLLRFRVNDAAAGRHGLSRVEVANALYGATRGLPVGQFRGGDDPVPVVVRSERGERYPLAELPSLDVSASAVGGGGNTVPLAQVARLEAEWRPGAILHRDRRRTVSVSSQLADGATYSDVTGRLLPRLAELELPRGVEWEMGGAAESSGDANSAMVRTVPAGVLLLLGILMAEFRSFRRVGIVLVTVPLAVAGIVPGLLLGDQPFGFMSLLGVLALAGVVVNNAIVLLAVVESRRREGAGIAEAVSDAVERRVRPILLTTATTVLGLLPLAFSPSTLWPPLAWTMISGLIASTLLTLLVVPALYMLLFRPGRVLPVLWSWRRVAEAAVVALALAGTASPAAASPHPPDQQGEGSVPLTRSAEGSQHLVSASIRSHLTGVDWPLTPTAAFPLPPDQQGEDSVSLTRSAEGSEHLPSSSIRSHRPGSDWSPTPTAAFPHPPDQQKGASVVGWSVSDTPPRFTAIAQDPFPAASPLRLAPPVRSLFPLPFSGAGVAFTIGEEEGGAAGVGSSGGADRHVVSESGVGPEPRTMQPRPRPVVHRKRGGPTPAAPPSSVLGNLAPSTSTAPTTTTEPLRLTLPEAMSRATSRPRATAAHHRATSATQSARAETRAGRLPTVEVAGRLLQRDRDLEFETPIGSFPFGDRRTEAAQLTVVQPLFVPERQLYAAPAARADARAAALVARRAAQRAALTASEAFLDVLAIDASLRSTDAFLASLDARLAEAEARAAAGRVLESDALKVRLARDSARQDRRALAVRRRVALMELARAVGEPGPVAPVWPDGDEAAAPLDAAVPAPPRFPKGRARALAQRPDLAALRAGLEAAELRRGEVRAELLPSLRATAGYTHQGGSPYEEDGWVEGGLVLSWRPLAAGTRAARAAARAGEVTALAAELVEARRGVELELGAAYADLDTAEGALEVGRSGVRQARETLRVERERHAAGRVTTNDLLAAEAALRRERTRRDVATLDVVRARVRVWTAMGSDRPQEGF